MPIKLLVDGRGLDKPICGIGRYLRNVLEALADEPALELLIALNRPPHPDYDLSRFRVLVDSRWRRVPGTLWFCARAHALARAEGAHVVWGSQHVLPIGRSPGIARLLTVHDLVHLRFPETMRWHNRVIQKLLFRRSALSADRIGCNSETTRRDLLREFPELCAERVFVAYPVAAPARPAPAERPSAGEKAFLLCVSTREPRKNLDGLVRIFGALVRNGSPLDLVLVGGHGWGDVDLACVIASEALCDRVHVLGRISDARLNALYQSCAALVFPSRYEGFGLPAIEAAGACPIVLNDIEIFREVSRFVSGAVLVDLSAAPERAARALESALATARRTSLDPVAARALEPAAVRQSILSAVAQLA